MRGVQVGRVAAITAVARTRRLEAGNRPRPDQVHPGQRRGADPGHHGVRRQVRRPDLSRTTPARSGCQPGQVLKSRNVSTEVNTVFQNLVDVLEPDRPGQAQQHAVRAGRRRARPGRADRSGHHRRQPGAARTQSAQGDDPRRTGGRSRASATPTALRPQDILTMLDAASTTSATITSHAKELDALLLHDRTVQQRDRPAGAEPGQPDQGHQRARADDEPAARSTTRSTPACWSARRPCWTTAATKRRGGNGRTLVLDAGLMLGDDPYHYPDNLPIVGAKGGPGGKPGCGSLPDVARTGRCANWSPTPAGAPAWTCGPTPASASPATPTTSRSPARCPSRRASATCRRAGAGPDPVSGCPALRAHLYAPDGTPLWPGLPPAPPPMAPRDPGATPGSEPFVVPAPAQMQPTPLPPVPLPEEAAPSP